MASRGSQLFPLAALTLVAWALQSWEHTSSATGLLDGLAWAAGPATCSRPLFADAQARTGLQVVAAPLSYQAAAEKTRRRIALLKRQAIKACLDAVKDDTEAVELCARLTRKLSFAQTVLSRIEASMG
eukprot:TRINITY_DN9353_c0_g1_i2.p1 TRINITY_DN9353_c0_g1~~TRINITY_DN9353_c0_g1_i2.p1  ORF type:complete len:128 (+),score=26.39 TRINITY_DN9353_c0_g1_i2:53-436(+)